MKFTLIGFYGIFEIIYISRRLLKYMQNTAYIYKGALQNMESSILP
jgi:hypothetical protein